ncbi:TRAP transporter large permease [Alicyclobacillus sp. SO9]|uniref:TRAP transporter large permease n=1 Tax=Alicyclobacillus sp. SO9 TaxID=2665646 RepID=UPI0018E8EAC5|nr:TRAP transporter large permease [Alicyclobacillus sp. SO9]QQE77931.1 TRAP transporter large permease [Alicyclobacillus sp. SO9]
MTTAIVILLLSFVILLIFRVPVALSLVISSILTGLYLGVPLQVVGQKMIDGLDSFSLLAIPLFILAGEIMGEGGISKRLIDMSNLLVGRFRGGLAMVNVVASMFFGGITGSSVADASSIGSIMIPMMRKRGYDKDYSVGVTITASIQGVIVPPSHNVILYALAAGGVSITALFAAGIIPGVVLGLALMVVSYIIAVRRKYPKGEKIPRSLWLKIVWQGVLSLTTAVIIIGGVLGGIFTANESAAIAVLYAFLLVFVVFRDVHIKHAHKIFVNTFAKLSAVLFLISASSAFSWFLSYLQIPQMVLQSLSDVSHSRFVVFFLVNLILLALGLIMDMAPLILIATPVLLPVVEKFGMDPVQFGIVLMLNLGIGLLTPPVGSALFVGCSIGEIPIERVAKSMIPFLAVMFVVLLGLTYVPDLTLGLPHLLHRG